MTTTNPRIESKDGGDRSRSNTTPRIAHVKPVATAPLTLDVTWKSGARATVDLTGLIARTRGLAPLANPDVFAHPEVIAWGYAVAWSDDIDISCETLWTIAEEQRPWTADDFRAWMTELDLSIQTAADVLSRSTSQIKAYRAGRAPVPSAVRIACRTLAREPKVLAAHYRPRRAGRPTRSANKRNAARNHGTPNTPQ